MRDAKDTARAGKSMHGAKDINKDAILCLSVDGIVFLHVFSASETTNSLKEI